MRKFFSLIAAVLFAGSMMAEPITINATDVTTITTGATTGLDVTLQDVHIVWEGAYYNTETNQDFRIYAGKAMTLTATEKISKIEIVGYAKKDLAPVVSAGTITTGDSYSAETTKSTWEDPLLVIEEINAQSLTITCNKQMRAFSIRITFEGEGGGEEDDPHAYDDDSDFSYVFGSYEIDDKDLAEYGDIYVMAYDEDEGYQALLDIYVKEGETGLVAGEYEISDSEQPGTVYPGETYEGDIFPSYAAIGDEESLTNVWYLVSGKIIISEDLDIVVSAENSKGKLIQIVISGPGEGSAVEATKADNKAVKVLRNGQLVIIKNGVKYNAVGQLLK